MPKRLQSVPVRTHPSYTNLSFLVVEGNRTTENYWYMRVGFGNQKYSLRSLKIPYNQEADNTPKLKQLHFLFTSNSQNDSSKDFP